MNKIENVDFGFFNHFFPFNGNSHIILTSPFELFCNSQAWIFGFWLCDKCILPDHLKGEKKVAYTLIAVCLVWEYYHFMGKEHCRNARADACFTDLKPCGLFRFLPCLQVTPSLKVKVDAFNQIVPSYYLTPLDWPPWNSLCFPGKESLNPRQIASINPSTATFVLSVSFLSPILFLPCKFKAWGCSISN